MRVKIILFLSSNSQLIIKIFNFRKSSYKISQNYKMGNQCCDERPNQLHKIQKANACDDSFEDFSHARVVPGYGYGNQKDMLEEL